MGKYDNPLHVGVDTVSQSVDAWLHVSMGTRVVERRWLGWRHQGQVSRRNGQVGQCTT